MSLGLNDIVKPFGSQGFFVGLGVAAVFYFLGPQLKESLMPAAIKGTQGFMSLGNKTKEIFEENRARLNMPGEKGDEFEGRTASPIESSSLYSELLKTLKDERESSNRILEELKNSIIGLREEITEMKNSSDFQH